LTFNVRIFGFRGINIVPQINLRQLASDSVSNLVWPYEWRQCMIVGRRSTWSKAESPDLAAVLRIEIPDGCTIRYELNPPNREVAATLESPSLSGKEILDWGPGWTISVIDAAELA